jgi:hypothetical protein
MTVAKTIPINGGRKSGGVLGAKKVVVYRPGVEAPVWEYEAKDDEFIHIGYMSDFVTVDFYGSAAEQLTGGGIPPRRKIFYGCSVVCDLELVSV